ncbi:MAG: cupin domain-containing protein [Burkholderiales bacterium]
MNTLTTQHEDVLSHELEEALLTAVAPQFPDSERAAQLKQRVLEKVRAAADNEPAAYSTIHSNEGPWISVGPLVDMKVLRQDGDSASFLLRVQAGGQLPDHVHLEEEECLVLEGSLLLGEGVMLRAGDYHRAPKGSPHGPASTKTGVLLFLRSDNPAYHP